MSTVAAPYRQVGNVCALMPPAIDSRYLTGPFEFIPSVTSFSHDAWNGQCQATTTFSKTQAKQRPLRGGSATVGILWSTPAGQQTGVQVAHAFFESTQANRQVDIRTFRSSGLVSRADALPGTDEAWTEAWITAPELPGGPATVDMEVRQGNITLSLNMSRQDTTPAQMISVAWQFCQQILQAATAG